MVVATSAACVTIRRPRRRRATIAPATPPQSPLVSLTPPPLRATARRSSAWAGAEDGSAAPVNARRPAVSQGLRRTWEQAACNLDHISCSQVYCEVSTYCTLCTDSGTVQNSSNVMTCSAELRAGSDVDTLSFLVCDSHCTLTCRAPTVVPRGTPLQQRALLLSVPRIPRLCHLPSPPPRSSADSSPTPPRPSALTAGGIHLGGGEAVEGGGGGPPLPARPPLTPPPPSPPPPLPVGWRLTATVG